VNCQQAGKLLPLYGSAEFESVHQQQLATHLELCPSCAAEFDDYRITDQLLLELTPPRIRDDVYDEIRRDVWRKIEGGSSATSFGQFLGAWFDPRTVWAVATVLLLVVLVGAIYLISNRAPLTAQPPVAGSGAELTNRQPQNSQPDSRTVNSLAATSQPAASVSVPPRHRQLRHALRVERDSLAANDLNAARRIEQRQRDDSSQSPAELDPQQNIRLEIQTSNPNIRIIWLVNPETKRPQNSKGN